MANKDKVRRMLQLHAGGMSRTSIAKTKGFGEHGVADALDAAEETDIAYQDVANMSDEAVCGCRPTSATATSPTTRCRTGSASTRSSPRPGSC